MFYINEDMLGRNYTREDADELIRCLQSKGYKVKYGFETNRSNPIPIKEWGDCLSYISNNKLRDL